VKRGPNILCRGGNWFLRKIYYWSAIDYTPKVQYLCLLKNESLIRASSSYKWFAIFTKWKETPTLQLRSSIYHANMLKIGLRKRWRSRYSCRLPCKEMAIKLTLLYLVSFRHRRDHHGKSVVVGRHFFLILRRNFTRDSLNCETKVLLWRDHGFTCKRSSLQKTYQKLPTSNFLKTGLPDSNVDTVFLSERLRISPRLLLMRRLKSVRISYYLSGATWDEEPSLDHLVNSQKRLLQIW